jgi:hypothetical protein
MGGMSRATVFREMRAGRLKARKLGARTLILASDWRDYLDFPSAPPRQPLMLPWRQEKSPERGLLARGLKENCCDPQYARPPGAAT